MPYGSKSKWAPYGFSEAPKKALRNWETKRVLIFAPREKRDFPMQEGVFNKRFLATQKHFPLIGPLSFR